MEEMVDGGIGGRRRAGQLRRGTDELDTGGISGDFEAAGDRVLYCRGNGSIGPWRNGRINICSFACCPRVRLVIRGSGYRRACTDPAMTNTHRKHSPLVYVRPSPGWVDGLDFGSAGHSPPHTRREPGSSQRKRAPQVISYRHADQFPVHRECPAVTRLDRHPLPNAYLREPELILHWDIALRCIIASSLEMEPTLRGGSVLRRSIEPATVFFRLPLILSLLAGMRSSILSTYCCGYRSAGMSPRWRKASSHRAVARCLF